MTTAGIAYPATGRANDSVDPDDQMRRFVEMLADVPENAALTLNANDAASSHIGELATTALANQGCRGVVVEGGVRDVEFILDQTFPVFAQFHTPADSVPRWELLEWGNSAVVGGVDVSSGDIVVGDIDGVAVVPEDVAEDVLLEAEREAETEDALRSDLEDGMNPVDGYEKHETF
jgi:regulator of RNase E activity RraA